MTIPAPLSVFPDLPATPLELLDLPVFAQAGIRVWVKRDDLIHPLISGNKWRKLKYNLCEAQQKKQQRLLTFGGAFSNHIYSLAAAGRIYGFKTIGMIRGEETLPLNATLRFARDQGMELHYLDRETYQRKSEPEVLDLLKETFGDFYTIPEGGSNSFALPGVRELLGEITVDFDYILCPVGTGGTLAGIVSGLKTGQQALGIAVLKGKEYLENEVRRLLGMEHRQNNWQVLDGYTFGGYAKIDRNLIGFIQQFETESGIPVDPVYTAKLFYAVVALVERGFFEKGKTILVLHTGGLQGKAGMEEKIKKMTR